MNECLAALSTLVAKVEEDLDNARKDVIIAEVMNTILQRDVHEVRGSSKGLAVFKSNLGCLIRSLPTVSFLSYIF